MTIDEKTVVSVSYRLTVSDTASAEESLVEETNSAHPFVFIFGSGGLLEDFENNLKGKKAGDTFDFVILSQNGYGNSSQDNIVRIPMEAFVAEGEELDTEMVSIGSFLPMVDDTGHQMQGLVLEITQADVVMDFNHPLAGKDLHFTGSVENVRAASPEEIAHGHVHGEGGHHH